MTTHQVEAGSWSRYPVVKGGNHMLLKYGHAQDSAEPISIHEFQRSHNLMIAIHDIEKMPIKPVT